MYIRDMVLSKFHISTDMPYQLLSQGLSFMCTRGRAADQRPAAGSQPHLRAQDQRPSRSQPDTIPVAGPEIMGAGTVPPGTYCQTPLC